MQKRNHIFFVGIFILMCYNSKPIIVKHRRINTRPIPKYNKLTIRIFTIIRRKTLIIRMINMSFYAYQYVTTLANLYAT